MTLRRIGNIDLCCESDTGPRIRLWRQEKRRSEWKIIVPFARAISTFGPLIPRSHHNLLDGR